MKRFFQLYLRNALVAALTLSLVLNFIIEALNRRSPLASLVFLAQHPYVFFHNALILFLTLSVALLFRHRIFVFVLVSVFWLSMGIANGVILGFRMTPFTVTDLSLLDAGLQVIPNYLSKVQVVLAGVGTLLLAAALAAVFFLAPHRKVKIDYRKNLIGFAGVVVLFMISNQFGLATNQLSPFFGNLGYAYRDYGFTYCFVNTWLNTGIDQPVNYNRDKVLGIFDPEELPDDQGMIPAALENLQTEKLPNVVMVQLESFMDPKLIKGLELSKDPIPNFHALQRRYTTGFLTVPSVGAGTANTEFEVITGLRIRFFGPGEYPYKSVLKKDTVETVAYDLSSLGYATHAIHNHRGAFYNRNLVFSHMGFDTFTSLEYMQNVTKTPRNWAKDNVMSGEILDTLQATEEQDFVYAITVQGHGKYPTEQVISNPAITVDGIKNPESANEIEYYVNQLAETDAFIGELIKSLRAFDEPTVVVFFGDHIPSLDINESNLWNDSIYETQYVLWSNFWMKKKDADLHAYQLSASTLGRLGIHTGVITNYHQNHRGSNSYLSNLKVLQYDMLYGNRYIFNEKNPFAPTPLEMGVKRIEIKGLVTIADKLYVTGENFTPYCRVYYKDDVLETTYYGNSLLEIPMKYQDVSVDDLSLAIVEKYNEILSIE